MTTTLTPQAFRIPIGHLRVDESPMPEGYPVYPSKELFNYLAVQAFSRMGGTTAPSNGDLESSTVDIESAIGSINLQIAAINAQLGELRTAIEDLRIPPDVSEKVDAIDGMISSLRIPPDLSVRVQTIEDRLQ